IRYVLHVDFFLVISGVEKCCYALLCRGASQTVNSAAFRNSGQPRAGVARNAVYLPAFQRIYQRILKRVFRQREISKLADEGRQNTTVFLAENCFDACRCCHWAFCDQIFSGRISIEPYLASGTFAAQLIASSRSLQSMR